MQPLDDTITALATAPGAGGLAVLRVSGTHAFAVSDRVFRGGTRLASAAGHSLHHGWAVDAARRDADGCEAKLDEVVAAVFRAPRSFTGEDTVEWSCHGGTVPAKRVLDALLPAGARLAGPGEFSLRAFLHGRIDLAQAEAVADRCRRTEERGRLALPSSGTLAPARLARGSAQRPPPRSGARGLRQDVGGIGRPREAIAPRSASWTRCSRASVGARGARGRAHPDRGQAERREIVAVQRAAR